MILRRASASYLKAVNFDVHVREARDGGFWHLFPVDASRHGRRTPKADISRVKRRWCSDLVGWRLPPASGPEAASSNVTQLVD